MTSYNLEVTSILPLSKNKPQQAVVLCHGYGGDGKDISTLAINWQRFLPDAIFLSPNAPQKCALNPFGYQWFSLQERTEEAMLAGVQKAQPILGAFIDQQLAKYKLTERNLALVGFSQGTMVSVFTVPRRKIPVAGVVAYSGRLIGKDLMAQEIRCTPPMVMINGDQDELVPVTLQPAAVNTLRALGVKIEGHIRPGLGHSIDDVGIKIAQDFLSALF